MYAICFLLKKNEFLKKICFKIGKGRNFAIEYVSNDIICWKCFSALIVKFFFKKIKRKSENY